MEAWKKPDLTFKLLARTRARPTEYLSLTEDTGTYENKIIYICNRTIIYSRHDGYEGIVILGLGGTLTKII